MWLFPSHSKKDRNAFSFRKREAKAVASMMEGLKYKKLVLCLAFACTLNLVEGHGQLPYRPPMRPFKHAKQSVLQLELTRGLIEQCKEDYRDVALDHFSWVSSAVQNLFSVGHCLGISCQWDCGEHTIWNTVCRQPLQRGERPSSRDTLCATSIGDPIGQPRRRGPYSSTLAMRLT